MTQQSSISKIECSPLGVLLRISAETVIDQSKMDTLWQRRKIADQAFVAFHRTMRRAAQRPAIVKEVKLRTRLLCQNSVPIARKRSAITGERCLRSRMEPVESMGGKPSG